MIDDEPCASVRPVSAGYFRVMIASPRADEHPVRPFGIHRRADAEDWADHSNDSYVRFLHTMRTSNVALGPSAECRVGQTGK